MRRRTPDMLLVPAPCDTSGCPTVAIPNGYRMQPRIPFVAFGDGAFRRHYMRRPAAGMVPLTAQWVDAASSVLAPCNTGIPLVAMAPFGGAK